MKEETKHITVLPDYFSAENWSKVIQLMGPEISADGKLYIEMMADLEENERKVINDGGIPIRIKVDADDLKGWVESRNLDFTPKTCLVYAIHKHAEESSGEEVSLSGL